MKDTYDIDLNENTKDEHMQVDMKEMNSKKDESIDNESQKPADDQSKKKQNSKKDESTNNVPQKPAKSEYAD